MLSKKNYTRYEKKIREKIFYLKKIYKFTLKHFLIDVIFVLDVKNVMENEKFYFAANLSEIRKKLQNRKLFTSKISAN